MHSDIYLIRHGVPDFPNGKSIVQGRNTDLALNHKVLSDARNLRSFFEDKNIENWYSSPLLRARQTLEQAAPKATKPIILDKAAEVYFGRWEGHSWMENKARDPKLFEKRQIDNTVLPEDAEPMREAAKRFKEAILETKGNSVIVAHWTVISLVYCFLSGFPFEKYLEVPHPYLGISKINREDDKLEFEYVGKRLTPCPECEKFEALLASQHNDGKI